MDPFPIIANGRTYSSQEIATKVAEKCAIFQKAGIHPGSRTALFGKADLETILSLLALFQLQATAIPLNYRLPPAQIPALLDRLDAHFFLEETIQKRDAKYPPLDGIATLLLTSGSTAEPKIAAHALQTYLAAALPLQPSDRYLLALPLYHVSGLIILFRMMLAKSTLVLMDKPFPDLPFTHASLVPAQLDRLLQENVPSEGRTLLLGGSSAPPSLIQNALNLGWKVHLSYGMTEMTATIAIDGIPLPGREVQIAQDGEIWVRGKTLFSGYFDRGNLLLPLKDGWFPTRDLGRWNQGKLEVIGRSDNLFISGGENIQPEEIEKALTSLPGIFEAIVVPLAHPKWGQIPVAFIDGRLEHIQLDNLLPKYKIPVKIFPMPKRDEMKPNRAALTTLAKELSETTN